VSDVALGGSGRALPRDERILELHAHGWSLRQIGAEVHLSAEGVRKVIRRLERRAELAEREDALLAERAELQRRRDLKKLRIRAIDRELRAIADERSSAGIDEILGLGRG
jgi:DNA-binding NarL/FixJ family response regulator